MNMMIDAFDPGKTTGWARLTIGETSPLELLEAKQIEGGAYGFLERQPLEDVDLVIAEQFVLDGRTLKPDLEPLKIEGIIIADAVSLQHELVFQRNNFKKHVDDAKLKQIGWYQKGMPHANDAIRHALAWAKTKRHLPTLEAYFH